MNRVIVILLLLATTAYGQWISEIWPAKDHVPREVYSRVSTVTTSPASPPWLPDVITTNWTTWRYKDMWALQCASGLVERAEAIPRCWTLGYDATNIVNNLEFWRYQHDNLDYLKTVAKSMIDAGVWLRPDIDSSSSFECHTQLDVCPYPPYTYTYNCEASFPLLSYNWLSTNNGLSANFNDETPWRRANVNSNGWDGLKLVIDSMTMVEGRNSDYTNDLAIGSSGWIFPFGTNYTYSCGGAVAYAGDLWDDVGSYTSVNYRTFKGLGRSILVTSNYMVYGPSYWAEMTAYDADPVWEIDEGTNYSKEILCFIGAIDRSGAGGSTYLASLPNGYGGASKMVPSFGFDLGYHDVTTVSTAQLTHTFTSVGVSLSKPTISCGAYDRSCDAVVRGYTAYTKFAEKYDVTNGFKYVD